jgi:D,D-heptose 1,7-bisphosphate phosphatase
MSGLVRQAVFLVGGKGTRLGALAAQTPKPLLEIAPGLRFLDVVLEEAARHGFDDIVLLAGHLGTQVQAAYDGRTIRGAKVRVVVEPSPLGTGGALHFARDLLATLFVLGNGDSLFDVNWRSLAAALPDDADARLALRQVEDAARYGAVTLSGDRIVRFEEKRLDLSGPRLINGGLYLLRRSLVDGITGPCSIERDVFQALASQGRLLGRAFTGYFLDIGLPDTLAQAQREISAWRQRPCAFFDRDGTLNRDEGYTHRPEDLEFLPGAARAIRLLNESGYFVIVVTNQAGVARGLYPEAQVAIFHQAFSQALAQEGAHIDAYYYCPFLKGAKISAYDAPDHPNRKPNPGMILRALEEWPIARQGSFLIGDLQSDLDAAHRAGLPGFLADGRDLEVIVRAAIAQGRAG